MTDFGEIPREVWEEYERRKSLIANIGLKSWEYERSQDCSGTRNRGSMSKQSSQAKAARSIKAELRMRWPEVPFTVRSSNFSGGTSVYILWTTGPTKEAVYKVVERYEEGTFDGMTDSYIYNTDPASIAFREKNGSAKYITRQNRRAQIVA